MNALAVFRTLVAIVALCTMGQVCAQTINYFGATGTISGSVWSTTSIGPYTSTFNTTGGGVMNFGNTVSAIAGASLTTAGITATADVSGWTAAGTISNQGNGVITISVASSKTLDFGSQSFTSSATAGYIKDGDGVVALAGNTYGGGFTLNAGTVIIRGANALGGGANNSLTINGGILASNATRDLSGKFAGANGISIAGDFTVGASTGLASASANLTFSNATTIGNASRTITIGANGSYTFGGVISGTGSSAAVVVQNISGATGSLIFTGANSYLGGTTITSGTLKLSGSGTLGSTNNSLTVNDGTLDLGGTSQTIGTLSGTGGTILNNTSATTATLTLGQADANGTTFSGVIADRTTGTGILRVTKVGNGTLSLAGTNTYTGNTTLSGGTLNLGSAGAIGTTGSIIFSGGLLQFSSGNSSDYSSRIVGSSSPISLDTNSQSVIFASPLASTNTGGLTKTGNGTLTLSGNNTYTGNTTISGGTLKLGTGGALADAVNVIVNSITAGTTALFDLDGNSDTIASLTFGGTSATATSTNNLSTGAGTLTLGGTLTYDATNQPLGATLSGNLALGANRTLTVGDSTNAANDLTVSANISGAGLTLTKAGTGTLALSGNNTYSGGTTLSAGSLISNSNNALGTGAVGIGGSGTLFIGGGFTVPNPLNVNSTGSLGGTGTVGGASTIASGGTVAPGSTGPGQLANSGTLAFTAGSTYAWDLTLLAGAVAGTNYDQILNTGTITLLSTATLTPAISASLAPGTDASGFWNTNHTWTVITSSGSGTITGTALAATNAYGTYGTFATAFSGNDLILNWTASAIPEPSTYAAIAGALALAGAFWHRRRGHRG